ncbi:hypothetical protein AXF42_Ash018211 [Apostasia shenzhenica]|uniref:DDT domain-containing protein n=1 Tax=Apostasia shenzhenica TaxID=1088818 RepID=A0A2I0B1C7_9ASPA|nr:hypothetical protein AXF42_Ash018211 [Apostasia shenzhenica]
MRASLGSAKMASNSSIRKRCKRGPLGREVGAQILNGDGSKYCCHRTGFEGKNRLVRPQALVSKEYILSRVFRKDGPSLAFEFDPLPANAFSCNNDSGDFVCCEENIRVFKRRKISKYIAPDNGWRQASDFPDKRYGKGKRLMTVWRATNPCNGKFPPGPCFIAGNVPLKTITSSKDAVRKKQGKSNRKLQKKIPPRRRKVPLNKDEKRPRYAECELFDDEVYGLDQQNWLGPSIDDEELELQDLEANPTAVKCCAHLASSGGHGCPLCKDLLARFPPKIVKMKHPIAAKPWDSSSELVKKLFTVFRFLYDHATVIGLEPFGLDDFAESFCDQGSLLLGEIHVCLLKLLLLGVNRDISTGFVSRGLKDYRYLSFLHFAREQEFNVNIWNLCLNSLTWTEILRQVMIAAGFGPKHSFTRRDINKGRNQIAKFGLRPRTLKGELFRILLKQGSHGAKVNELTKAPQIVALNMSRMIEEQEQVIYTTLSSDVTLFEKIGCSTYRLRVYTQINDKIESHSEDDGYGSVDDESIDGSAFSSSDDSEHESSGVCEQRIVKYKTRHKKPGKSIEYNEIDESYAGEAWILGLMEGDYSQLSIEEKLDVLLSLVDLVDACSAPREVQSTNSMPANSPSMQYLGSGAKLKRLPSKNSLTPGNIWKQTKKDIEHSKLRYSSQGNCSQTSSMVSKGLSSDGLQTSVHSLKAIHLGSDRRYNNYWLFLGPCDRTDPGHRRVYFESSEDGHWQVIDTTQALRDLLLALDCRGMREARLFSALEKREAFLCQAMDGFLAVEYRRRQAKESDQAAHFTSSGDGSPVSDVDNILTPVGSMDCCLQESSPIVLECWNTTKEKNKKLERLQAYDRWIWSHFYSSLNVVKNCKRPYMESLARCENCHDLYWRDEKHCRICHTTFEIDFDLEERYAVHVATCRDMGDGSDFTKYKVLSSQLQALKAAIHAIEGGMPAGSFTGTWKSSAHKLWVKRLRRTSSLPELMQVLSDFVAALNVEWLYENASSLRSSTIFDDIMIKFQSLPQTISSVALWMTKLDRLIAPFLEKYHSERCPRRRPKMKGK